MKNIYQLYPELKVVHHKGVLTEPVHISYVNRNNLLGSLQQKILLENYEKYSFRYLEEFSHTIINPGSLFTNAGNPLYLEIGFGKGESTFNDALENPDVNFFCFDVFLQGFVNLIGKVGQAKLNNIILCHHDALDFIKNSAEKNTIDRINIFFADPWPKSKHKKRRIVNFDTVDLFLSVLKPGGLIHFATDISDYAEHSLCVLDSCAGFENVYDKFAPKGLRHNITSYERKAILENREIFDIVFRKKTNI